VTQFYQTPTINLAGGTSVNFGLYGQADVGHLEIAPSALSFFPVPAGSVGNELTAQLTNDRPVTLRIWQMTTAGSGFVRTGGNCPEPPMEFGAYMGCMLKYTFAHPGRRVGAEPDPPGLIGDVSPASLRRRLAGNLPVPKRIRSARACAESVNSSSKQKLLLTG